MDSVSVSQPTPTSVEVDLDNTVEVILEPIQESVEIQIEHNSCCHLTFSQIIQIAGFVGSTMFSAITLIINSIYGRFG